MWYAALDKLIGTRSVLRIALTKLAIDQVMFVPIAISGYMIVRGVFERKTQGDISTQLQEKVPIATTAAWQFWPIANIVSFCVVPLMYRVLYGNVVGLFWNARLSHISTMGVDDDICDDVGAQTKMAGVIAKKIEDLEGFDESLPTFGFDEAWLLGAPLYSQAILGTGFDEFLPTSGFDEASALGSSSHAEAVYGTGFDEALPTVGFDEAWQLRAASEDVYE